MTKLSGSLPKDADRNGLMSSGTMFLADDSLHAAIVLLKTHKVTTDMESGESEATIRVARVELIPDTLATAGEQLLRRALTKRLGTDTLPFDIEDDITYAFGNPAKDLADAAKHLRDMGVTVTHTGDNPVLKAVADAVNGDATPATKKGKGK